MNDFLLFSILVSIVIIAIFWIFPRFLDQNQLNSTNNSNVPAAGRTPKRNFSPIGDNFNSIKEVQAALKTAGLESCNLIIGIDYTQSNQSSGQRSFGGKSLHSISPYFENPYQQVISILGRTLEEFDEDKLIPVFGFGDVVTKGHSVFPFYEDSHPCYGFEDVLARYSYITPGVRLSGPTNFAPIIREAIKIVKQKKDLHILVIIADGLVTSEQETRNAIVEASNYPLSIVVVGVGDGPFELMHEFDDNLPERRFDNFQFIDFTDIQQRSNAETLEPSFALQALMELPEQLKEMKRLKLFG